MIAAVVLLAAAQPLHFTVTWETAEVRSTSGVVARLLCTGASGADLSLMTDAQRNARDDVIRRIDSSWGNESRRGRMRLSLALSKADGAAPKAGVHYHDCRFLFPDETVVRADIVVSFPSGSSAVVVEDLESGQYVAVERLGKPSELPELFHRLFALDSATKEGAAAREELLRRIKEAVDSDDAKVRPVPEVNGQRELLPAGATDDEIGAALARMWDNLDGEPRTRIERVLGILAVVEAEIRKEKPDMDTAASAAVMPASVVRFKGVPAIEAPAGTHLVRTSKVMDGALALQPPPEEIVKPFYGRRVWWTVDFSASFPSQVERVLRGDRP